MKGYPCDYEGRCRDDCPRYLDDCDGIDEDIEAKADLRRKYGDD